MKEASQNLGSYGHMAMHTMLQYSRGRLHERQEEFRPWMKVAAGRKIFCLHERFRPDTRNKIHPDKISVYMKDPSERTVYMKISIPGGNLVPMLGLGTGMGSTRDKLIPSQNHVNSHVNRP